MAYIPIFWAIGPSFAEALSPISVETPFAPRALAALKEYSISLPSISVAVNENILSSSVIFVSVFL